MTFKFTSGIAPSGITLRLILWIGLSTGLVIAVTDWVGFVASREALATQTNSEARKQVAAAAAWIDGLLFRTAMIPRMLAARQQSIGAMPERGLLPYLVEILRGTSPDEVFGCYIAFEKQRWTAVDSMPWVDRNSYPGIVKLEYDFHDPKWDWYHGAKRDGKLHLTEPYFDEGGSNILMVSLTQPIYFQNEFVGVAGADIAVDQIEQMVREIRLRPLDRRQPDATPNGEFAYLVTPSNRVFAHPDQTLNVQRGHAGEEIQKLDGGERIRAEPAGDTVVFRDGRRWRIYWASAPRFGWRVVLNVPEDVVFGPVQDLRKRQIVIGLFSLVLLAGIVVALSRRLTQPVERLTLAATAAETGDYSMVQLGSVANRGDELGSLARAFQKMVTEVSAREEQLLHVQQSLKEREQYFRSLIENAPDLVVLLEENGRIRYLSPSARKNLGFSPEELVGTLFLERIHPDDQEEMRLHFDPGAASDGTVREFRFKDPEGTWRFLEATRTNLLADPAVRAIVVNCRDVSQQRRVVELEDLREKDRQKTEELERTLARLKSTQQQLVVQEKLASLGALTAGIAHEIKNPLNFVTNFADLAGEMTGELAEELEPVLATVSEEQREPIEDLLDDLKVNVTKIGEHGRRADGIVRNMLLHSRGGAGEWRKTDLNALLTEYLNLAFHGLRATDPGFQAKIELDLDPNLEAIEVIAQDLSRVLLNLSSNACYAVRERQKLGEPGYGPTVRGTTRNLPDGIEIRIRDNGTGISKAIREKVFEPFFTTKPTGSGTGLGLSISYDIVVTRHEGELRVESEEGHWTEFTVRLPKRRGGQNS